MKIDNIQIGEDYPVYIIAEIGINHNGSIENAFKLIDLAKESGCDAVKFQKRTPELAVPKDQWNIKRQTPWGEMTYIDYKNKIEFTLEEYKEIDSYCKKNNITWFASCWDHEAVKEMVSIDIKCFKIASASAKRLDSTSKACASGKSSKPRRQE